MALARTFGRALSETGRALDRTGCRWKGVIPFEQELCRQQTLQKLGEILPTVGLRTWLAPNCRVIGEVQLGNDTSVGFASTIRGDVNTIRVGDRVSIGDMVVIHANREGLRQTGYETNIGHDCTVSSGALIHGATLEDGCFIGEGATVLDGAVVGAAAFIAPGSVVLKGSRVGPSEYWSGSPAKLQRKLNAEEVASLKTASDDVRLLAKKQKEWDSASEQQQSNLTAQQFFARE